MNNNQYTVQQTNNNSYYDKALKDFDTILGLIAFVVISLAILWVWSMISMINLNSRFKEFMNIYNENNSGDGVSTAKSSLIIDSVDEKEDDQIVKKQSGPLVSKAVILLLGVIIIVGIVLIVYLSKS